MISSIPNAHMKYGTTYLFKYYKISASALSSYGNDSIFITNVSFNTKPFTSYDIKQLLKFLHYSTVTGSLVKCGTAECGK